MPWKTIDHRTLRRLFVSARWANETNMAQLCRRFGISRQCGYEWWRRASAEGLRLTERSHRTRAAEALGRRWRQRVVILRRRYSFAGADVLRWHLRRQYPLGPWPCARTIGRWLKAAGLTRKRKRRARPGPTLVLRPPLALQPNDVWTVDFKGWFRTADGRRIEPLTVRDQATRFLLAVRHVAHGDARRVATILRRLFARYGAPKVIHVDNGPPFGGIGPRGWSHLAVGWIRCGIDVSYSRPACPQDNAGHEQMHQVLQDQTARPPAANPRAQQRRFDRWRHAYNYERPNHALGLCLPCAVYERSRRCAQPLSWSYPRRWLRIRADVRGRIFWAGRQRVIGRAFAHQVVALKPLGAGIVAVYFGAYLLGELHAADPAAIRPVTILTSPQRSRRSIRPGG